jgi:hypothetical protein
MLAAVAKILSWAGTALSPATNTAAVGSEYAPVTRPIQRKSVVLNTVIPFLQNTQVFLSQWFDTQASGAQFIVLQGFTATAAGSMQPVIYGTNDPSNTGMKQVIGTFSGAASSTGGSVSGNTLWSVFAFCPYRYYQVSITGTSGTASVNLAITVMDQDMPPGMLFGMNQGTTNGTNTTEGIPFGALGVSVDATSGSIHVAQGLLGGALQVDGQLAGGAFNQQNQAYGLAVIPNFITNNNQNNNNSRARTPVIYRGGQIAGTSAGSTTIWQPSFNLKPRLMKYKIEAGEDCTITSGPLPVNLQLWQGIGLTNAAVQTVNNCFAYSHRFVLPAAVLATSFNGYDSGWIDIGNGVNPNNANTPLQAGLLVPQTTGAVNPTWTITSNQWEAVTVGFKTLNNAGNFFLKQTFSATSAVNGNLTLGSNQTIASGDTIIVVIRTSNGAGGAPTVTVTDSGGNAYTTTAATTNATDDTNGSSLFVAYVTNCVGFSLGNLTVSYTVNANAGSTAVALVYGNMGSGGRDSALVGATGNSTSPASGNYTPGTVGDLLITAYASGANITPTSSTTPTAYRNVFNGFAAAHSGSLSVADNWGNGALATGAINIITIGTEE